MPNMSMYQQLEASLHDIFWQAEGASKELPLLEKFLTKHSGSALELGCGSGRLLAPLLENGHLIEGLDSSSEMLALCRENWQSHEPVLHHQDICNFQTGSTYTAITIPAFTIQLVPYAQITQAFKSIYQHLHPEGGFYLTTFIPWAEITGELEEDSWYLDQETTLPDGNLARCHTKFQIKRMSQQLTREHRYEILSPSEKILETSKSTQELTWLWPRELEQLLQEAGFSILETFGDFQMNTPCHEDSQIITTFAQRDCGE